MAITSVKTGSSFTNLKKYDTFLAGNAAYNPSSYESIATFSPSGTATVTFSSIPSTYASLQIRYAAFASGENSFLRLNADTGTNYVRHGLYGTGATAAAFGSTAQSSIGIDNVSSDQSTTYPTVGIVDIHDYASNTKNKTVRIFSGIDKNGSGGVNLFSGLWLNTNTVTSLTFFLSGNFTSGSTISLYGIKGA